MPQTFFHAGKHRLVVTGLDVDHAVGCEACLCERGREQVGSRDAPQGLAGRTRCDAGREQRSGRAVNGAIAAASYLMQRTASKAPAREARVDLGDPERENRFRAPASAFDLLDLRAQ